MRSKRLLFWLPTLYWFYLAFMAQTVIVHDSVCYEDAARTLLQPHGLTTYLQPGPGREPLYPALVSLAMRLEKTFDLPYIFPLRLMQFGLLLLTQCMVWRITKMLPLANWLRLTACLYIGLSPALINGALGVYPEILALPLTTGVWLYSSLLLISTKKKTYYAVMLGLMLAGCTLTKGAFELIGPLFLLLLSVYALARRDQKNTSARATGLAIGLLLAAAIFYLPLLGYKYLNYRINGNFILTDRVGYALAGSTLARVQPAGLNDYLAAAAWIPSPQFCSSVMSAQDCAIWSTRRSDDLGTGTFEQLTSKGKTQQQATQEAIWLSVKAVAGNPLQYLLLSLLLWLRIFFWESMTIGFVLYPTAIRAVFDNSVINTLLIISMGLLTLRGFGRAILTTANNLFGSRRPAEGRPADSVIACGSLLAFSFVLLHAPFYILPRYSHPLAALWVVLIIWMLGRKKSASHGTSS